MEHDISVILIAHNEEQVIGGMIEGFLSHYDRELLEIIVVDDASTDSTAAIVEAYSRRDSRVRLVRRGAPRGAGRALKTGFQNISPKAAYVLTMDSDFIENIKEVRRLIDAAGAQKYDGIIGSRFIREGSLVGYPLMKKTMNRLFHAVVRALFGIRQRDLTNNFKLYKSRIFKELPWVSNGYAINAETGIFPVLAGYRIGEVPVSWIARGAGMGKSKFNLVHSGWGYIMVVFYAFNFLRRQHPA